MKTVVSLVIGTFAAWAAAEVSRELWVAIFAFIIFTYAVALILYSEKKP